MKKLLKEEFEKKTADHKIIFSYQEYMNGQVNIEERCKAVDDEDLSRSRIDPYPINIYSDYANLTITLLYNRLKLSSNCFEEEAEDFNIDSLFYLASISNIDKLIKEYYKKWFKGIKKYHFIIIDDDDRISAIAGFLAGKMIEKKYEIKVTYICAGGKGMLSKHFLKKEQTEADIQSDVLKYLGVEENQIVTLGYKFDNSHKMQENTGDIVKAIDFYFQTKEMKDVKALYVLKQRSYLRPELTVKKKAHNFSIDRLVIHQDIEKVPKSWNYKGIMRSEPIKQEVALTLPRLFEYNKFLIDELPKEFWDNIEKKTYLIYVSEYASQVYDIRVSRSFKGIRNICKMVYMWCAIKLNKAKAEANLLKLLDRVEKIPQ